MIYFWIGNFGGDDDPFLKWMLKSGDESTYSDKMDEPDTGTDSVADTENIHRYMTESYQSTSLELAETQSATKALMDESQQVKDKENKGGEVQGG